MTDVGSERDPLEELAEEFAARYRRGERPSLAEYVQKYPDWADEIRDLFPALIMLEDVRPGTGPNVDDAPAESVPFQRLGEYRIIREIGRGGMGVVYEAEQESLGRRVAIKVLPPGALADPRQVERFRREARAAARLHHTNLVPLFGVGEESGTHYYVMQYIEGCPLDDVLAQLRRLKMESSNGNTASHGEGGEVADGRDSTSSGNLSSAEVARSLWKGQFRAASRQISPDTTGSDSASRSESAVGASQAPPSSGAVSESRIEASSGSSSDPYRPYLRSVAHLGIQVADALEYAAGQGILHRDVKPSNLLLDMYGTVWLTDFGLAKTTGTADLTHTGDLFGTLRYMAPERFQGKSDIRSDVYALGLTLYELLALRPAFADRGQAQLVRHITLDAPPRLDEINLSLPRDLVTIVHKATAKDPGDRYQTPGALAEDLRRFLEDRPILARRLSVSEQAWRWCRRNPAAAALVGLIAAMVVLGVANVLQMQRQEAARKLELAKREARVRQSVETALEQAAGLRRKGLWAEAKSVLAQAELRLDDARSNDLTERLAQAQADLELVTKLESNRLDHRIGLFGQKALRASVAEGYAQAFQKAGFMVTEAGHEVVVAARIRRSEVCAPLVAALDDWALVSLDSTLRARVLRVARLSDPDPAWRDRVRNPDLWQDRRALEQLMRDASNADPPPQLLTTLGVLLQEAGGDPEPLLRAAQQRRPADFWLNFELGMVLRSKKPAEALGYSRAALVARPENGMVHNLLGLTLWADQRWVEATAAFRRAVELDPKLAAAQTNLGMMLTAEGNLDEAVEACRKAVQLDPHGGIGFNNLAKALAAKGLNEEALAAFHKTVELDPKLATTYNDLGNLLLELNRRNEAVAAYRKALEVDPKLAAAHHNLGNHFVFEGRLDDAIASYRKAIALDPRGPMAHKALGETLIRAGRYEEAAAEAHRWLDRFSDDDPRGQVVRNHWKQCQHQLVLNSKLAEFLEGTVKVTEVEELCDLAAFCLFIKRRYATASRLYETAFSVGSEHSENLRRQNFYNAACASALAGSGKGIDADRLSDQERAAFRRQAFELLNAHLGETTKAIESNPKSWPKFLLELRHWQHDGDLAGIRDANELARLPQDEQTTYRTLWNEVSALLEKSESVRDNQHSPQSAPAQSTSSPKKSVGWISATTLRLTVRISKSALALDEETVNNPGILSK